MLTGLFSLTSIESAVYAQEATSTDEEKPYTIQDFFAYMQHGYQQYNIFCEDPKKTSTLFTTDETAYEYRAIDTDTKTVTGEIAVICKQENEEDADVVETEPDSETEEEDEGTTIEEPSIVDYAPIANEIEQNEADYIGRIYSGSKLPKELSLTYIQADELSLSDLTNYDLYIFENSSKDIDISEEIFLQLDKMLKKDKETLVYAESIIWDTHGTGEIDGSAITVIENSNVDEYTVLVSDNSSNFLVGMSTQGNGFIYNGTPKQKDIAQEGYVKNGYEYKWTSYLLNEQKLSYGILLFYPYTTIKVLPTYKEEVLNRDIFKSSTGKKPQTYFRYISQIILPSKITTIPDNTFYNYDVLEKINLDSVTTIGSNAFNGCKLLKSVQFSDKNNVIIKESAFENCGLETVAIPSSVKKISKNAFVNNYITDPRSLEYYATTYDKYKEYQAYIKEHSTDEEKEPSIKSVHIITTDNGLDLEENAFSVEDTCQVSITYQPENGVPTFEFTNQNKETWESSELSATQLNSLNRINYLRSEIKPDSEETGKEEHNTQNENIHNVTFVDTRYSKKFAKTMQVENGKQWSDYQDYDVRSLSDMDLQYTFIGWITQNGQSIGKNDIINLQKDITLYAIFDVSGSVTEKVFALYFYNYDNPIHVNIGKRLCDYTTPSPTRDNDTFLGWSKIYPITSLDDIIYNEQILISSFFGDANEVTLYPVFQSDLNDKTLITTPETLNGKPIYRLNDNNIGSITNYDNKNDDTYALNQSSFNDFDKKNAEIIKNKILKSNSKKIAILPKGYTVDTNKLKKKGYLVIKTNLQLDDYISALTYMNCRYFQYLQLIQTPYFETENELNIWDKNKIPVSYDLIVNDFEISDYSDFYTGFIYFIQRDVFKDYYDICMEMEKRLKNINQTIGLQKGVKVTDALWKINDLCIKDYAYDYRFQIYDLNWFLQVTDEQRNTGKKANYHGVCASYSKLAFALLGLQGYEALPTAVGNGKNPTHSITRAVINGKVYYCDYTWTSDSSPEMFMFLSAENLIFEAHRNPIPDDMGHTITFDRKSSKLTSTKVKSAKNQKGKKLLISFNKIKNVDGYEIQYGTNSKFKSAKKKSVSKTKAIITKLKKNKTYYVRVRPYKNMKLYCISTDKYKTIKYYGTWSKYKKVRIKK